MIHVANADVFIMGLCQSKPGFVERVGREGARVNHADVVDVVEQAGIEGIPDIGVDPFRTGEPVAAINPVARAGGLIIDATIKLFAGTAGRLVDGHLPELGNTVAVQIEKPRPRVAERRVFREQLGRDRIRTRPDNEILERLGFRERDVALGCALAEALVGAKEKQPLFDDRPANRAAKQPCVATRDVLAQASEGNGVEIVLLGREMACAMERVGPALRRNLNLRTTDGSELGGSRIGGDANLGDRVRVRRESGSPGAAFRVTQVDAIQQVVGLVLVAPGRHARGRVVGENITAESSSTLGLAGNAGCNGGQRENSAPRRGQ